MIFFIAFVALLLFSTGFAVWKGGPPERIAAGLYWGAWLVTLVANPQAIDRWRNVEIGYLLIDTGLLLALAVLALRANRIWPMAAASLQLIIVAGHAAKALDPALLGSAYAIMSVFWPFLQLLLLVTGTWAYWRRTRIQGAVSSWSRSSLH
ncbi:hypothetical protein K9B35_19410 [Sphingomonas sp. R647]|uniref:hypothetical protein n=1 Tax=Sphingomonas sp. R647 TaxID=2875233 RepID=UPI001CD33C7E|nr:hypothetical protein [Sphingomonas sp. R647]MCA1200141.1 hypothetical protein [Sphingomonas sp. R647]